MSLTARYIGLDEVLEAYNKYDEPFFSMWDKNTLVCQYAGNDKDKGEEILTEEIQRNIKRGYANILKLCIHPEKKRLYTAKDDVLHNIYFKSFDAPDTATTYGGGNIPPYIVERLNAIESKLNALAEINDDDDDDDDEKPGLLGQVEQLAGSPVIMGLIDRIFSIKPGGQVASVGSQVNDQVILELVQLLMSKGLTIDHLRKLAALPSENIKALLNYL